MKTSQDIQSLFKQALSLHQRGFVKHARTLYEQILAREPAHFDSCHLLGVTYIQTRSPQQAVDLITRALEINPESADAHYNLAHALQSLERTDEALSSFGKAIGIRPDFAAYHLEKGILLQRLNRHAEAEEFFGRAARLDPSCIDAHRRRAIVLASLSRPEDALASIEKAIHLDSALADTHRQKAIILRLLDRLPEAVASYDMAIRLAPDHPDTHIQHAAALFELRRFDPALASCDRAIALNPASAEAFAQRGSVLDRLDRTEEALESFGRALELEQGCVNALLGRAWLHARREQWDLARGEYEVALGFDRANLAALRGLAALPEGYLSSERASELLHLCSRLPEETGLASRLLVRANLLRHLRCIRESFESLTRGNAIRLTELRKPENWRLGLDRIIENARAWEPQSNGEHVGSPSRLLVVLGPSRSGKTTLERQFLRDKTIKFGFEGGGAAFANRSLHELSKAVGVSSIARSAEHCEKVINALFNSDATTMLSGEHQLMTITNPLLLRSAHLIFDLYPQSWFVFLDREAIDNAAEVFATDYRDKFPFAYSPRDALDYVASYQRASAILSTKMGSRAMTVSYEELLSSPGSVLSAIYGMLGLDPPRDAAPAGEARDPRSVYREYFAALCAEQGIALERYRA